MGLGDEVHIIPLGFEIDRAVKPFERFRNAKRVHLLVTPPSPDYPPGMDEQQPHYVAKVTEKLKAQGIEVEFWPVNLFDIKDVMKNVARLILQEKRNHNDVYVNMSAAGRLTSVGATLAAMAHKAKTYYVDAQEYPDDKDEKLIHGLSICKELKLTPLMNFRMELPEGLERKILVLICEKDKVTYVTELLDELIDRRIGLSTFTEYRRKYTNFSKEDRRLLLQKNMTNLRLLLDKLNHAHLIKRKKDGKFTRIKITETGKYVANILGMQ